MTRETSVDLWSLKGKQYNWTIEHIFPQGDNIPESWIKMIADGDLNQANKYREQYTHTLGNLTISGYNSTLGNKSFVEKRDRTDKKGRFVGYKNGLYLNSQLAVEERWTAEKIQNRTSELVNEIVKTYTL